ncbi:MAG: flagellar biosynthetic protein FliR [Pyrinomonadaceae bacterium]
MRTNALLLATGYWLLATGYWLLTMDSLVIPLRPALVFAVVLARVGGLVTFAPFWSHRAASPRVRVVLAFALSLALLPAVQDSIPTPPLNVVGLALVLAGELLIGLALGFVGRLVFSALETAAFVLGAQIGFALAATIDPSTRAQTTALGTIAQMLGLALLLSMDGHHWLLAATVKSFQTTAPGAFAVTPQLAELVLKLSAQALAVGVALAAPAIIVLLVVELALAIAGRAAPQLQIMVLGFPIKIAAGLWLTGASLYFLPGAVRATLSTLRDALAQALAAM